jgi:hypothetical protein
MGSVELSARDALRAQVAASTPKFDKERFQVVTPEEAHKDYEEILAEREADEAEAARIRVEANRRFNGGGQ